MDTLLRILDVLPEGQHPSLIEAYLKDQCPPKYRPALTFSLTPQSVKEAHADYLTQAIPAKTRAVLDYLATRCDDLYVRQFLHSLAHLISDGKVGDAPVDPLASDEQIHRQRALDQYHASGGTWHVDGQVVHPTMRDALAHRMFRVDGQFMTRSALTEGPELVRCLNEVAGLE